MYPCWVPRTLREGGPSAAPDLQETTNPKGTNSMRIPLSILDLAPIAAAQTAGSSFAASVALAQRAEELGYQRVWYAEHHNMPTIASSATSVLIAHVARAHARRSGSAPAASCCRTTRRW